MSRIDEFITYLRGRVGHSIYVWGAQGEKIITLAWITRRESDNQNQINRVVALWNNLKSKGITDIQAFDCSGLVMYWLQNTKGYIKSDMSAASIYGRCEKLSRSQLKPGDFVFKHNGSKISHVGVYVGDGKCIECYGRDKGVVEADINAWGKSYWNRYGRLALLRVDSSDAGNDAPNEEVTRDLKLSSPMMKGEDVKALQSKLIFLGYDLGSTGADGTYGAKTDAAVRLFQNRAKTMDEGVCDEAMRLTLVL